MKPTRKQIIEWAREAGIDVAENNSFADDMYISVLYRFANIVSAVEREGCAEVCELMYDYGWLDAKRCAREIRARREQ